MKQASLPHFLCRRTHLDDRPLGNHFCTSISLLHILSLAFLPTFLCLFSMRSLGCQSDGPLRPLYLFSCSSVVLMSLFPTSFIFVKPEICIFGSCWSAHLASSSSHFNSCEYQQQTSDRLARLVLTVRQCFDFYQNDAGRPLCYSFAPAGSGS